MRISSLNLTESFFFEFSDSESLLWKVDLETVVLKYLFDWPVSPICTKLRITLLLFSKSEFWIRCLSRGSTNEVIPLW